MSGDTLDVTTDARTDFWRHTHYGFVRDSGHLFGLDTAGDFTAEVRIQARFTTLYDQAGLMVRLAEDQWLKAGIEYADGTMLLSSVLTLGTSDWATAAWRGDAADFYLRLTVARGVLRLQASTDGKHWPLVRLCSFPVASRYLVGPMCCTPERAGLQARFTQFVTSPPLDRDLHDLSV